MFNLEVEMSIPRIPEGRGWIDSLLQLVNERKPVQVYKNLHKGCWSVRQDGKVVAHLDYICLNDCDFKVGKAGRDRVRKEGVKNVHAYVTGYVPCDGQATFVREDFLEDRGWKWQEVTYNPYENDTFVSIDTGKPIEASPMVDLDSCELFGNVMAMVRVPHPAELVEV
jgi:hypothetical protein